MKQLVFLLFLTLFMIPPSFAQYYQVGKKLVGETRWERASQGQSVGLSADGKTLAIGGPLDSGSVGAVWMYALLDQGWIQKGKKLVGTGGNSVQNSGICQGTSVSLSEDGTIMAVGGSCDSYGAGATWVFRLQDTSWVQMGEKLVPKDIIGAAHFGNCVSLSADGKTLAIGGQDDHSGLGAAWVYRLTDSGWHQMDHKLIGTKSEANSGQGFSVSLSGDGRTLAVGGLRDSVDVGAVWMYMLSDSGWVQMGKKLVGKGAVGASGQGTSVSLSHEGNSLVVGAQLDDSEAGATWIYFLSDTGWAQMGEKRIGSGAVGKALQGWSVSLASDGRTFAVGGWQDNSNLGAVWLFALAGNEWVQIGSKLVGTDTLGASTQGFAVSLSADGTTVAVGAPSDNVSKGATWVFSNTFSNGISSIENINSAQTGSASPNPFTQTVQLSTSKETIYAIFALNGRLLETGNTTSTSIGSTLQAGTYLVKMDGRVIKIVKMPF